MLASRCSLRSTHSHARTAFLATCALVCLTCIGCSEKTVESYRPKAEQSRPAIEAALNAWKSGQKPGKIELDEGSVQVQDGNWQSGKKLKAFELLEEIPGETPRFKARLTLEGTAGPMEVEYVVVGTEGDYWVMSKKDFDALEGKGN